MSDFKYDLRQVVRVVNEGPDANDAATVVARSQSIHSENIYQVRYRNRLGVAVEEWWHESDLDLF